MFTLEEFRRLTANLPDEAEIGVVARDDVFDISIVEVGWYSGQLDDSSGPFAVQIRIRGAVRKDHE